MSLIRLVSSSAANGILVDLFETYGPDSYLGRVASVMMSCTETVFYTMSLYFLSVGIHKTRWTLPCAILANIVGVFAAVWLVGVVFEFLSSIIYYEKGLPAGAWNGKRDLFGRGNIL